MLFADADFISHLTLNTILNLIAYSFIGTIFFMILLAIFTRGKDEERK